MELLKKSKESKEWQDEIVDGWTKMTQELKKKKKSVHYPAVFCNVAVRAARTHRKRSQLKCKKSARVVR